MSVTAAGMGLSQVCIDARARHQTAVAWQQRWSWLWLILGVLTVALLVVAAIFFLDADVVKAALSAGSSIVSGVAARFILDQRKEAKNDANEAWDDVKAQCPHEVKLEADARQRKLVKIAFLDRSA